MPIVRMDFVTLNESEISGMYSPEDDIEVGAVTEDSYSIGIAHSQDTYYLVDFENGTIEVIGDGDVLEEWLEKTSIDQRIADDISVSRRGVKRLLSVIVQDEPDDDTERNAEIDLIPYSWKDRPCCRAWRWEEVDIKPQGRSILVDGVDVFEWMDDPDWDDADESVMSYVSKNK